MELFKVSCNLLQGTLTWLFNKSLKRAWNKALSVREYARLTFYLDGIIYLGKLTNFDHERIKAIESVIKVPLIVLRVETLPRNALVEVELYCNTNND